MTTRQLAPRNRPTFKAEKPKPPKEVDYYRLSKVKELRYDYGLIEKEHGLAAREAAEDAALDILKHGRAAKDSVVAMGQRLIDVKAMLPEWTFTDWIEKEFDLSIRSAQNLMNVARQYGERGEIISLLSDTVLYLLSAPSTPESVRAEVEAIAVAEGKSPPVARVKAIKKAYEAQVEVVEPPAPPEPPVLPLPVPEDEPESSIVTIRLERSVAEKLHAAVLIRALRYHLTQPDHEQVVAALAEALA